MDIIFFWQLCQLAEMNPDVQFLQVNYEEHKSMCYSLNVHVLPFFRLYRGAHGRLCSFSCTNATVSFTIINFCWLTAIVGVSFIIVSIMNMPICFSFSVFCIVRASTHERRKSLAWLILEIKHFSAYVFEIQDSSTHSISLFNLELEFIWFFFRGRCCFTNPFFTGPD
jgi:hypothetical protein